MEVLVASRACRRAGFLTLTQLLTKQAAPVHLTHGSQLTFASPGGVLAILGETAGFVA
jgi:hypothetical protein